MGGSGAAEEKIEGGKRCSLPKLFQQEGLVAEICVCVSAAACVGILGVSVSVCVSVCVHVYLKIWVYA